MLKINEKIDLSKKVLDIDVYSPIFAEMLDNLNAEIQRTIKKVYDKDFANGEISLKLSIDIPNAFKNFSKTNEFGEVLNETYTYRAPKFEHKITTTLKKQFKQEGTYEEEREVKLDGDRFVAIPVKVKDQQISIDDIY